VWSSPLLATGATYTQAFSAVGSYPYHCTPHPGMRGTVTVE
jgi:plastocyanin